MTGGNSNRLLISVGRYNESGVQTLRNLIEIKTQENREYQAEIDLLQPDRRGLSAKSVELREGGNDGGPYLKSSASESQDQQAQYDEVNPNG